VGGGKPIRFWQRRKNDSRASVVARISTLSAFWLQVFLSGALMGLGFFFLAFYESYLYTVGFRFGYDYLLNPLTWLEPYLMVIGAGIGFVFAYCWFKMAERPSENADALIFTALLYFIVIIFVIVPIFMLPLTILAGQGFTAVLIHGHLFMDYFLVLYQLLTMGLMAIPAYIVLIAGILESTSKIIR
jgi:hypothetical protein